MYKPVPDDKIELTCGADDANLCLAKTHPWLSWRKDAYSVLIDTANITKWLNQNDTKAALHVDADAVWRNCDWKGWYRWDF